MKTLEKVLIAIGCIAALAAILIGGRADAQTVNAEASLSWVNPTTGCVGTVCNLPLDGEDVLTKLQLYASTASIPDTPTAAPIELPPNATTYAYTTTAPNGSTLYFRLRACTARICSAVSNQAQKLVRVVVPGVPAGIEVTITVTVVIATP